jgi:hypothetical protein
VNNKPVAMKGTNNMDAITSVLTWYDKQYGTTKVAEALQLPEAYRALMFNTEVKSFVDAKTGYVVPLRKILLGAQREAEESGAYYYSSPKSWTVDGYKMQMMLSEPAKYPYFAAYVNLAESARIISTDNMVLLSSLTPLSPKRHKLVDRKTIIAMPLNTVLDKATERMVLTSTIFDTNRLEALRRASRAGYKHKSSLPVVLTALDATPGFIGQSVTNTSLVKSWEESFCLLKKLKLKPVLIWGQRKQLNGVSEVS